MQVELLRRGGTILVTVRGEVDVVTAPAFRDGLERAVGAADSVIEVDLSGATFFGSEGVNALARALKLATERGLQLRVSAASRIAARVLQITGLADALGATTQV